MLLLTFACVFGFWLFLFLLVTFFSCCCWRFVCQLFVAVHFGVSYVVYVDVVLSFDGGV